MNARNITASEAAVFSANRRTTMPQPDFVANWTRTKNNPPSPRLMKYRNATSQEE